MNERPLEYCFICDEPTGRAGKGEDSLYCDECDKGPYCPDCFRKHHESDVKVVALLDVVRDCVNFLADLNTTAPTDRAKSLHKRAYTAHSKAKSHADTLKGE